MHYQLYEFMMDSNYSVYIPVTQEPLTSPIVVRIAVIMSLLIAFFGVYYILTLPRNSGLGIRDQIISDARSVRDQCMRDIVVPQEDMRSDKIEEARLKCQATYDDVLGRFDYFVTETVAEHYAFALTNYRLCISQHLRRPDDPDWLTDLLVPTLPEYDDLTALILAHEDWLRYPDIEFYGRLKPIGVYAREPKRNVIERCESFEVCTLIWTLREIDPANVDPFEAPVSPCRFPEIWDSVDDIGLATHS